MTDIEIEWNTGTTLAAAAVLCVALICACVVGSVRACSAEPCHCQPSTPDASPGANKDTR